MMLLIFAFISYLAGAAGSILLPGRIGRVVGFALLGVGAGATCDVALHQMGTGPIIFGISSLHVLFRVDDTASFFAAIIGVVAALVAIFGLGPRTRNERGTGRTSSASANAIAFASLLCCCSADILLFIFAWEMLALVFFWAVAYSGKDPDAAIASYLTIVITHVAGACMIGALLFLAHHAGSFSVAPVIASAATLPLPTRSMLLLLLLVGFGAKFGILPLQVWMPYGYRAAPPLVAALMAGGALNVGFYGVARFIVSFPSPPVWFAALTIILGALAAFFGICWAAIQRDLRQLAAYSSVENAGIILAAFGIAIAGKTLHLDMLVGLGIAAAYAQILAHALAKSTLFLSIGSISDSCSTTAIDRLGGLARRLPITTVAVLFCAMSLAALPPMTGFVGEWMVLESFMQAFRTGSVTFEVVFAVAGALIGIAAGVTIVTVTKLVGSAMLGAPRSAHAFEARESRSPCQLLALILGLLTIVSAGIFATPVFEWIGPSIDSLARVPVTRAIIGTVPLVQPAFTGFSSISALGLAGSIGGFTFFFWILSRLFRRPPATRVPTWTSGEPYRAWTQYTGTGFAHPTQVILNAKERFGLPFYQKAVAGILRISDLVRATQSGVIAAYLSYILVFTILLLILYPSIRHW